MFHQSMSTEESNHLYQRKLATALIASLGFDTALEPAAVTIGTAYWASSLLTGQSRVTPRRAENVTGSTNGLRTPRDQTFDAMHPGQSDTTNHWKE